MLGKVTSGSSCSLTPLLSLTQHVPDSYNCPYSSCQIPAVPWLLRVTLTPPAAVQIPDLSLPHGTSTQGVRVKLWPALRTTQVWSWWLWVCKVGPGT